MIFFKKHKKQWIRKVSLGVCAIFLFYPLILFGFCPCSSTEDTHSSASGNAEAHHDHAASHSHEEDYSNSLITHGDSQEEHPHPENAADSHSHSEKESSCCCQISQDPLTLPSEMGLSDASSIKKISFFLHSDFSALTLLDFFPSFYTHYGTAPPQGFAGRSLYLQHESLLI